jgi:hypothetical protein
MQVNVFITPGNGQLQNKLLVLPITPTAAIPKKYRVGWTYYTSVSTADRMFGDVDAATLEDEIAAKGFAVVVPETADRR